MNKELTTATQSAPLEAIMAAMANPDVDADKLGKLLDVQERWEANGAKKAYTSALVSFQTRAPVIKKGDTANGKPYARMDRIWREVRPLLTDCGLAVSWQSADYDTEKGSCTIDGLVMHADGHSEPIHYKGPAPEAIRGQNAAQVCGSAVTYCKRYALCNILGINVGDDDDGYTKQIAAEFNGINDEQAEALRVLVAETKTDKQALLDWAGAESFAQFPADKYAATVAKLRERKSEADGVADVLGGE
jgi:hypothetical protein